jgi:hypothetical protein
LISSWKYSALWQITFQGSRRLQRRSAEGAPELWLSPKGRSAEGAQA